MNNKIDSVSRNYFNPVDAIKLYADTNNRTTKAAESEENPFANTRSQLGLWQQPTAGYVGQVNGEPPAKYYKDQGGYIIQDKTTLNLFA